MKRFWPPYDSEMRPHWTKAEREWYAAERLFLDRMFWGILAVMVAVFVAGVVS